MLVGVERRLLVKILISCVESEDYAGMVTWALFRRIGPLVVTDPEKFRTLANGSLWSDWCRTVVHSEAGEAYDPWPDTGQDKEVQAFDVDQILWMCGPPGPLRARR